MNCERLCSLESLRDLRLVGGVAGLDREIRWIYFADTLESVKALATPEAWIDGNELYVLTNSVILNDVITVLGLMKAADKADAAGFIIDEEYMKQEYIDYAETIAMPLFELPRTIRSIDLSQVVCTEIIEEKNTEASLEKLFIQLIHSEDFSEENMLSGAELCGVSLSGSFRAAIFDISDIDGFAKRHEIDSRTRLNEILHRFKRRIRKLCESKTDKRIMIAAEGKSIIALLPAQIFDEATVNELICSFHEKEGMYTDVYLNVSVGCAYSSVKEHARSYAEARRLKKLVRIVGNDNGVLFYERAEFYMLILSADNTEYLRKYCMGVLGKLIGYDTDNNSELLKTLEMYIACNGNSGSAAERLFIHRNTMHYRMEKIAQLTGYNMGDYYTISQIVTAFKIKKYLEL